MESYIVDESVLGEFVDALLKEKYPNEPVEAHADLRKVAIAKLNHQILKAILGSLTPEQGAELNKLLDENGEDPEAFENFFKDRNLDLEKIITDAMVEFKNDFEKGGEDA